MLRPRTVFVVGAGASNEVEIPIGPKLRDEIGGRLDIFFEHGFQQTRGDTAIVEALRSHVKHLGQRDINSHLHAGWRIRDAMRQASSFDQVLDSHAGNTELELCGKLAITISILEAERNCDMFVNKREGEESFDFRAIEKTWFTRLGRLLVDGVNIKDIDAIFEEVAFIVFNYDRCLEHYLFHFLKLYYGVDSAKAIEVVSSAKIFHPYGRVGHLEWQAAEPSTPFGGTATRSLLDLASQIRTFTERVEDGDELNQMRLTMRQASTVVFLGFGYHRQNLELIDPIGKTKIEHVVGTGVAISDPDRAIIVQELAGLLASGVERIVAIEPVECARFLDDNLRLLSK